MLIDHLLYDDHSSREAVMSIKNAVKEMLKNVLPPPVKSFMRESDIIKQLIARQNEQHQELYRIITEQQRQLDQFHELLSSINRENLHQYFESHSERIAIKEQYLQLTQKLTELENRIDALLKQ